MPTEEDRIWQLAAVHGQSSQAMRPIPGKQKNVCWCCFSQVERQQVPLCESTKQLQFLGFGVPIYFSFIRCCILLLIASIFSYNLIDIYRNYSYNSIQCHHNPDQGPSQYYFFSARKFEGGVQAEQRCISWQVGISATQSDVDNVETLLRVCSFLLHLVILIYIQNKQVRLSSYYDEKTCTLSDFSIVLNGVPEGPKAKQRIATFIDSQFPQCKNHIEDIILIPDSEEIEKEEEKQHKLIVDFRKKVKKAKTTDDQLDQIEEEIEECQRQIEKKIRVMKKQYEKDQINSEMAIVIFDYEISKEQVLSYVETYGIRNPEWKNVRITEAGQPEEMIWENMGVSRRRKRILFITSLILSLGTIIIFTAIFAVIIKFKTKYVDHLIEQSNHHPEINNSNMIHFLSYGSLILVILFNKVIMAKLFHKFTDIEREKYSSDFQFSFCVKYCLGLFFTTALMTLLVEDLMFNNYFTHPYGVVASQSIMFMMNSIFVPFFWWVNPFYIQKNIKRFFAKQKRDIRQEQANFAMENPSYQIGKRYAEIIEVMWFTFLYVTIIPMGALFSVFGLGLYYWVDKYNLLRKSTLNIQISGKLSKLILKLLNMTLVWRAAGQIWFDYRIRSGTSFPSWIMLAISVIILFLPLDTIVLFIMGEEYDYQKKSYLSVRIFFKKHYYNSHLLYTKLKSDRQNLANFLHVKLVEAMIEQKLTSLVDDRTSASKN